MKTNSVKYILHIVMDPQKRYIYGPQAVGKADF